MNEFSFFPKQKFTFHLLEFLEHWLFEFVLFFYLWLSFEYLVLDLPLLQVHRQVLVLLLIQLLPHQTDQVFVSILTFFNVFWEFFIAIPVAYKILNQEFADSFIPQTII